MHDHQMNEEEAEFHRRMTELPPRIKAMSMNDPLVNALVRHYAIGEFLTYEDLLEQLLFHVYELKENMRKGQMEWVKRAWEETPAAPSGA